MEAAEDHGDKEEVRAMSEKKDNPVVSVETCEAHRKGIETEIQGLRELFEEKIKGVKTSIVVGVTASTTIIVVVQFLLSLK